MKLWLLKLIRSNLKMMAGKQQQHRMQQVHVKPKLKHNGSRLVGSETNIETACERHVSHKKHKTNMLHVKHSLGDHLMAFSILSSATFWKQLCNFCNIQISFSEEYWLQWNKNKYYIKLNKIIISKEWVK